MASINHPLSIPAVKAFAWSIVKNNLTNRKPNNIDCGRSRMANFTVYEPHFTLLEKIINDLELAKKPEHIFNCDESMVAMDRRTGKVVVSRKTKQAYSES